ncbi:hypothetical protein [Streptosporangium sp. NBC_01756]|uniref:hypothetical protein n=1 Tax=Streptosporangium sp. NBC_01756 TaxID=2975950 RepID=UPI002DD8FB79|nr:hypothetical protein [Streptosporangium sp. NBC_01756]WSC89060.1 hypothetical protein OIE48_12960 [Streptosporangium sp. NBC_01756]
MAVVVLGIALLSSGCIVSPSTSLTLRVAPAALDNIRGIGKVQAEASDENENENGRQIENLLVIDVEATSGREALGKAADLLGARKWRVVAENRPTIVSMESANWQDTHLVLRPFHPAYFEDYPDILEALKEASVKEESLVYIEVFEGEI